MKINNIFRSVAAAIIVLLSSIAVQSQSAQTNKAVIDEIVSVTTPIYAFGPLKESTKEGLKEEMDKLLTELRTGLSQKLETISELTPEDRENVMTNFGPFANEFRAHCESVITRGLEPEVWVANSLRKRFSEEFTSAELVELNEFLKGDQGKLLVAMLKEEVEAQTEGRASDAEDMLSDEDAMELAVFFEKPVGRKFMAAFDDKFEAILLSQVDEWKNSMLREIDREMEDGRLFEMLTKFMVDNKLGRPQ